jgi:hypothetical protein
MGGGGQITALVKLIAQDYDYGTVSRYALQGVRTPSRVVQGGPPVSETLGPFELMTETTPEQPTAQN